MPITTSEQRQGAQMVIDFIDAHFLRYQDDPNFYTMQFFRHDWHKFIKDNGLEFKGGW